MSDSQPSAVRTRMTPVLRAWMCVHTRYEARSHCACSTTGLSPWRRGAKVSLGQGVVTTTGEAYRRQSLELQTLHSRRAMGDGVDKPDAVAELVASIERGGVRRNDRKPRTAVHPSEVLGLRVG